MWLLLCITFVELAMLEYAYLLKLKFGQKQKINPSKRECDEQKKDERCRKIDRCAMIIFFVAYALAVYSYFYFVINN